MSTSRTLLLVSLMLMAAIAVPAQQSQYDKGTPPQHAVGISSFGSYTSTELGNINLASGALNFNIPLGSVGGRGLSLPLSLNYSSKLWSASIDTEFAHPVYDAPTDSYVYVPVAYADYDQGLTQGGSFQHLIGAGWTIGLGPSLDAKRVLIGKIPSGPNAGCYSYVLTKLTLYLPDRGEIELRDDATDGSPLPVTCAGVTSGSRGTRWHATDGSQTVFINDVADGVTQYPAPNLSGVLITSDGTRIRFGGDGAITDRNGNKIVGLTDPLGRTITVQHNVPDPENTNITLAVLITIPGYGGPRYYKIKTGIMNQNYRSGINPNHQPVINGDWDPSSFGWGWTGNPIRLFAKSYGLFAQRIDDLDVLTELVLPDGRSLQFKYNEFGEVAEVQLPSGGKIQYDYAYRLGLPTGNSPHWETGTGGGGTGITTDVKQVDRAVISKRTYQDGSTLDCTWAFNYSSEATSVIATSPSDTVLSNVLHRFLPASRYTEYPSNPGNHDGSYYSLWSTGVEWRTEVLNADGSAVISATEEDWTQRTPVVWPTYSQEQPANDNRVNQSRSYLETGAMAKVETLYDQFNNPTQVKEYDFDQTLKRRSVTTYSATELVNGTNYAADSIHLLRLPLQQSIYDGLGPESEQARTVYEYDIYAADNYHGLLTSYSPITGHDTSNYGAGYTTRGNVTRIANWIKSSNNYLYSYPRYDIVGNVVSTKDARGFETVLSFVDDFGNGASPGNGSLGSYGATYAFPTLVTSPPPNPGEQPHTSHSQYDFSTGLLTGFKDRNGIVTQTIYNDSFNRPTLVKNAIGVSGIESREAMYYAPTTALGITLTKNDVLTTKDLWSLDDAVLRSWTKTDGFGRTIESWSKDPQGDVKVSTVYDALGRTSQVSNPYRPSAGEVAIYTTTAYDLAGRVNTVQTPDTATLSTSYVGNTVTVTDQMGKQRKSVTDALGRLVKVYEAPNAQNYLTDYTYDVLGNLTGVSQYDSVSQITQTRTFAYDSLKRLTSAINPESGTVTYQYDEGSNLRVKTDARGVSSHYDYDALNRSIRRWYNSDPAITATTNNVPALPSSVGASDEVKYLYDSQALPQGAPPNFVPAFSQGRSIAVIYGNGTAGDYYSYDEVGRIKTKIQQTGGINYPISSLVYHLAGGIISAAYPSGRSISYSYDTAGRINTFSGYLGDVTTNRTYSANISYSPFGGMTQEQLGTATHIYNKLFYNSRGQLAEIRAGLTPNDTSFQRGNIINYYGVCWGMCGGSNSTTPMPENNGNLRIQQVSIPRDENPGYEGRSDEFFQFFEYDSLNRLQVSDQGNWRQEYKYDRYGNRTIRTEANLTYGLPDIKGFEVQTATNRLYSPGDLAIPNEELRLMRYDAAGNLRHDTYTGQGSRTYDAENRMVSAQGGIGSALQYYSYDGDGRRVKRKVNNVETWQVYGIGGELIAEYAANAPYTTPQKEYGYRNGQLLVTATVNSATWGPPPAYTGPNPLLTGHDIKLENLTELRTAVNSLRAHAGLSAYNFTVDPNPARNETTVKADHIRQLRAALEQARTQLGLSTGGYEHPTLTENESLIYAKDFQELREQITSAWNTGASGVDIRWLVADQLGTPRMIFDLSGSLASTKRHDYLPFGEELFAGTGGRTTGMGYTAPGYAPVDGTRQQFTQKERDDETGLDYFLARYHSSPQGRFTSPDEFSGGAGEGFADAASSNPTFYADLTNPQTLNKYQYCINNPLRYTDPSGHQQQGNENPVTQWLASLFRTLLGQKDQYPEEPERRGPLSLDTDRVNALVTQRAGEHAQLYNQYLKTTGLDFGALQFVEDTVNNKPGGATVSGAFFVVNMLTLGRGGNLNEGGVRGAVVIGENMAERVVPTAEAIGAKVYKPVAEVTVESCAQFVSRAIKEGKRVFDIGIEGNLARSEFYAAESARLTKMGFNKVERGSLALKDRTVKLYEWVK